MNYTIKDRVSGRMLAIVNAEDADTAMSIYVRSRTISAEVVRSLVEVCDMPPAEVEASSPPPVALPAPVAVDTPLSPCAPLVVPEPTPAPQAVAKRKKGR